MKKLVILRGKPTSGKSTAFHNLKKKRVMKDWDLIDHPSIKRKLGREGAKKKLYELIKGAMENGKNILTEETSRKTLNKSIGYYIRKHNYKIIIFQFEIGLETSEKRDVNRVEKKQGIHTNILGKKLKELHEMHNKKFDKTATLINTRKLSKNKVIDLILKKLRLKWQYV